jgi:hypothetical protein
MLMCGFSEHFPEIDLLSNLTVRQLSEPHCGAPELCVNSLAVALLRRYS